LYCPFSVSYAPVLVNSLSVTYLDSDGQTNGSFITASLVSISHKDGTSSTLFTFSSNGFGDTTTVQNVLPLPTLTLNTTDYDYYIKVDMKRTSTAIAILYMLAIGAP